MDDLRVDLGAGFVGAELSDECNDCGGVARGAFEPVVLLVGWD
jgi:hypothetical protein